MRKSLRAFRKESRRSTSPMTRPTIGGPSNPLLTYTTTTTSPTTVLTSPRPTPTEQITLPITTTPIGTMGTTSEAPYTVIRAPSAVDRIQKWKISFDGTTDAMMFLEQVEEQRVLYRISPDEMADGMSLLLKDNALKWYRNNRPRLNNWVTFESEFRKFFLPPNYEVRLEQEAISRTQKSNESGVDYLLDMHTLLRRVPNLPETKMLYWMHNNLLPAYRHFAFEGSFHDMDGLLQKVREYERLTAYVAPTLPQYSPGNVVRTAPMTTPSPVHVSGPRTNSTPNRPTSTPGPSGTSRSTAVCFRCGETGHFRTSCTNEPRIFCSRCKKPNVMSRDCNCPRPAEN